MLKLPEIETERLLLRQFTPADLELYTERIFADPDVTHFLPKRDISPCERTGAGIEVFRRALAEARLR